MGRKPTRLCQAACVRPRAGNLSCEVKHGVADICSGRSEEGALIILWQCLHQLWWLPHHPHAPPHLPERCSSWKVHLRAILVVQHVVALTALWHLRVSTALPCRLHVMRGRSCVSSQRSAIANLSFLPISFTPRLASSFTHAYSSARRTRQAQTRTLVSAHHIEC